MNPFEPPGVDADQPRADPRPAAPVTAERLRPNEWAMITLVGVLLAVLGWYVDGVPLAVVGVTCALIGVWGMFRAMRARHRRSRSVP